MLLSRSCSSRKWLIARHTARRAVAGAIGAGAIASAMLFGAPLALAGPPPPLPPNCAAADHAAVDSRVSAATSAYLFTHPEVNEFFTSLRGQPKTEIRDDIQNYLNANPQVRAELRHIRQPLVDLKNRCGADITDEALPE